MAKLYLLGTGAAVSDPHRTTTMLAVENEESLILIDCGGDVMQRLMALAVDMNKLDAMIISHEHADHVSGFPLFMEKIWLLGRRKPVLVYGIAPAISQARRIHDAFDTSDWPEYPGVVWKPFPLGEGVKVFSDDNWELIASPGKHSVPVVGLRIQDKRKGGVIAYSCDTEFSPKIVELAQEADILVHEATGASPGHSSADEAARVAVQAEVKQLLLVHLPPEAFLNEAAMKKAKAIFASTEKGIEGGVYTF